MTTTTRLQELYQDNPKCPNGCEAAVAVRTEEDEVFYKDRDQDTDWAWMDFSVKVEVPVFWCERCGEGWTDHRAEDLRSVAIAADQMARNIDRSVVEELKLKYKT